LNKIYILLLLCRIEPLLLLLFVCLFVCCCCADKYPIVLLSVLITTASYDRLSSYCRPLSAVYSHSIDRDTSFRLTDADSVRKIKLNTALKRSTAAFDRPID